MVCRELLDDPIATEAAEAAVLLAPNGQQFGMPLTGESFTVSIQSSRAGRPTCMPVQRSTNSNAS